MIINLDLQSYLKTPTCVQTSPCLSSQVYLMFLRVSSMASVRTATFSKCMPRQCSWKSKLTKVRSGLLYQRAWKTDCLVVTLKWSSLFELLSIFYQVQTNLNVKWRVFPILLKTWNEEGIHRNYYCEYHIIGTQILGKLGAIIPSLSYLNHLSGTQSSSLLLSLSSGGPNQSHLDDITEEVSAQPRSLLHHTTAIMHKCRSHTSQRPGAGTSTATCTC